MKKILLLSFMMLCLVSFASANLIDDIESYWGFNENTGTFAEDDLKNHNATLTNSSMWTTNSFIGASAINFGTSTSDYVDLDGALKSANTGDFTINMWINANSPGSTAQNPRLFHSGEGTTFTDVFEIRQHARKIYVGTSYGINLNVGGADIALNEWVMVTVKRDSSNMSLFINGNLDKFSDNASWNFNLNDANINILGKLYNTGTLGAFNGSIDEVAIWDSRALPENEILELYADGQGIAYPFVERGVFISAFDLFTGNPTSNLIVTLSNGTQFVNNTGNFIYFNVSDGSYSYNLSSTGYVSIQDTIFHVVRTDISYNLIPTTSAPLEIRIRDANTGNLITQTVNVTVQSDTNQFTNSTNTGTIIFQPVFNIGDSYAIILDSLGAINYTEATYDIIYNSDVAINGIDLFMTPFVFDGEFITFVAQRPDLTLIQDALVTVERFVNGTYQIIGQKNTDIIGEAVFFLEPGKTHRITVSKDGFVTQTFITTLSQTIYSVILPFETDFDYDSGYAGITHNYSPRMSVLLPQTQQFNFTVSAELNNLQYMQVFLRDADGNVITSQFSNNLAGTQLTLSADLSPYNNSFVTLDRRFKVVGFPEQRFTNNYNINELEKFTGTIQELRTFLINDPDVTLAFRISLFAVFFIISMIVLATVITGIPNLLISLAVGLLTAYVVGVNFYIIAVIFLVLGLLIFAVNFRETAG